MLSLEIVWLPKSQAFISAPETQCGAGSHAVGLGGQCSLQAILVHLHWLEIVNRDLSQGHLKA